MEARDACDRILELSAATNGLVADITLGELERRSGVSLEEIRRETPRVMTRYRDLQASPARQVTSAIWSGVSSADEPYVPFSLNRRYAIPWMTLTGRQQFFQPVISNPFSDVGSETEQPEAGVNRLDKSREPDGIVLRMRARPSFGCFGSFFSDIYEVQNLGEGTDMVWLNPEDASCLGIDETGWVELEVHSRRLLARCRAMHDVMRGTCLALVSGRNVVVSSDGKIAESPGRLFEPLPTQRELWLSELDDGDFDLVSGVNLHTPWITVRVRPPSRK
jgi:nitrate reductase alpha subunit